MHTTAGLHYGRAMQFPDSTFAALRIRADDADQSIPGAACSCWRSS
jgi:hypothetical protein